MGLKSRNKGKTGEREIALIVSDLTGWTVRRKVRQLDGESDLEGVPGWCIEVKRHATATRGEVSDWWLQATMQATSEKALPVLFYRKDRDEWRAVWALGQQLGVNTAENWLRYEWAIEGSIAAWAAVAREIANLKEAA
ncbi:putative PDDEXK endonuclease [Paraburkholderia acidisoli]|uniref:Holliday junction resolvase n=1 Tax=Paraburkholderia acidisoli TaxID=2571748 RepID=A0A7Z2GR00_9BURK|nr:hypothetical protein [Paraburkholderia acidisoli]QGZ66297.1 hypothetical protein FAZ98_31375 [Paraburkholderia acidisoli]QGZ66384.1 hypothetical protein FAZ98_31865 [Paraburkholderia acidisoli]